MSTCMTYSDRLNRHGERCKNLCGPRSWSDVLSVHVCVCVCVCVFVCLFARLLGRNMRMCCQCYPVLSSHHVPQVQDHPPWQATTRTGTGCCINAILSQLRDSLRTCRRDVEWHKCQPVGRRQFRQENVSTGSSMGYHTH